MAKKAYEESNIANIAVAIREKTGGNQTYKTSEMPSGINEIYEKGCVDGYNDGYTQGDSEGYDKGFADGENSVVNYMNLCSHIRFNNLNLFGKSEVVLDLPRVYDLSYLCSPEGKKENTNTTVEHITINCPNEVTVLRGTFSCSGATFDNTLKRITFNVNTQKVTNSAGAFEGLRALEVLDGIPLDFSSCTNIGNTFNNNGVLREFRIVPLSIKLNFAMKNLTNLSNETIQSIIDGLADLTGQTAQTLTLHADVGAKLTDEQKAVITVKNWILAY